MCFTCSEIQLSLQRAPLGVWQAPSRARSLAPHAGPARTQEAHKGAKNKRIFPFSFQNGSGRSGPLPWSSAGAPDRNPHPSPRLSWSSRGDAVAGGKGLGGFCKYAPFLCANQMLPFPAFRRPVLGTQEADKTTKQTASLAAGAWAGSQTHY